jgi:hypothetical protein
MHGPPLEVERIHNAFDAEEIELYVFLYRNSDYSVKPNCKLNKHGKAVNRLSYQPLQVALLLKLISRLTALAHENRPKNVPDMIRQIGTITPEKAQEEVQELGMWDRVGVKWSPFFVAIDGYMQRRQTDQRADWGTRGQPYEAVLGPYVRAEDHLFVKFEVNLCSYASFMIIYCSVEMQYTAIRSRKRPLQGRLPSRKRPGKCLLLLVPQQIST